MKHNFRAERRSDHGVRTKQHDPNLNDLIRVEQGSPHLHTGRKERKLSLQNSSSAPAIPEIKIKNERPKSTTSSNTINRLSRPKTQISQEVPTKNLPLRSDTFKKMKETTNQAYNVTN
jgi:hypothetical protein